MLARVEMFFDQKKINENKLAALIDKFGLNEKWQKYQQSL